MMPKEKFGSCGLLERPSLEKGVWPLSDLAEQAWSGFKKGVWPVYGSVLEEAWSVLVEGVWLRHVSVIDKGVWPVYVLDLEEQAWSVLEKVL